MEKIIFSKSSDNQPVSSTVDELLKIKQLLDVGVLTEEEFQKQKIKILNY
ncbi:SHOCT domain-containing protein [Companilactobacillus huachuanensis]|uniref:SHOCT domain-containing protein n=1 Tax=Companilactobacillus huachuanensis TaxID=2559914 RepID=A0ABW1RPR1_9LACO